MTDASGATITVTTNGSTTFNATIQSTVASLVAGEQVQVTGPAGSDGTVTATAIRVGGAGGGGGFGGGGNGGGNGGNAPNTTAPGA
jgi:hypothetical protein